MTIWHVQKLYTSEGCSYEVLPYDFIGTIKVTLKMNNGILEKRLDILNGIEYNNSTDRNTIFRRVPAV